MVCIDRACAVRALLRAKACSPHKQAPEASRRCLHSLFLTGSGIQIAGLASLSGCSLDRCSQERLCSLPG